MILLLGGTSHTAEVAERIATLGYAVLVSTATEIELATGSHPSIRRRSGRLQYDELVTLIRDNGVVAVIDVTHPFATIVRENARKAAEELTIPYLTFIRPRLDYDCDKIHWADDHEGAAKLAFSFGRPVLTTTGSKVLEPYAWWSRETGTPLIARVLDYGPSISACREAGLDTSLVIARRGPFSVDDNLEQIKQYDIGVIVTKESGKAGGVGEKVEAAKEAGCELIVVRSPVDKGAGLFETIDGLINEFKKLEMSRA